ncbi:MAG TPA: type IV toxin-antitoxin system AbiEi family antitoxin domain-containing protein [Actinopolymorphaceae bacterium]|mgnify:CR=1 FL=1
MEKPDRPPAKLVPFDVSGIFDRRQALAAGFDDSEIQRLIKNGTWRRLRRGLYVKAEVYEALDPFDVHRLEIQAALRRVRARAVASHTSAGVLHRLDMHEPDLSVVHLTRPDLRGSRFEDRVRHHSAQFDLGSAVLIDGIPTTPIARTVIDIARHSSFAEGVVVADSALRQGVEHEALLAELDTCRNWVGARTAGRVVSFADGRAESVGESLARVVFHELGLPAPQLQVEFCGSTGTVLARVDFYFPDFHTVVEFDGKIKYQGANPGEVYWQQLKRENLLRERFGLEVVRMTWTDLYPDRRAGLNARIRTAFRRGRQRAA